MGHTIKRCPNPAKDDDEEADGGAGGDGNGGEWDAGADASGGW